MTSPGGAEAARLSVRVLPDTSVFARSLLRYLERIEQRTVVKLKTDLDGEQLVRQAREVAAAAAHAAKVQLAASVDAKGLLRDARKAADVAGKGASVKVGVELDAKKVAAFTASLLTLIGAGAKLGITAAIAASAAVQFANLAAALAPAAGAVAFLPAIALTAAAAIGTLKIAFAGLGAALKGDPEALARLAPAARAVVTEISRLTPAWQDLTRAVQSKVFAGVAGDLRELAAIWLPILKDKLSGIGEAWNAAFRDVAGLLASKKVVADLTGVLGNAVTAGQSLSGVLKPLVSIFINLAAVGSDFLPGLAGGFFTAAEAAAQFIQSARESGQLKDFFVLVGQTLKQIGAIAVQLGGILAAVFNAAQVSGGGLLNNLEEILRSVNAFLSAGEGQTVLRSLFASVQSVVSALLPILTDLIGAVGPGIAVLLGPEGLAGALKALAPAAKPVGQALGLLAKALAPLLVALGGQLGALLTLAATAIAAFAAEAGPLIGVFAQLSTELTSALLPAFVQLVEGGLPYAIQLGLALAEAFRPLVPVIVEMAKTFLSQVIPAMTQLQGVLNSALLPAISQAAMEIGGALLDGFKQLAPHVPALADAAVSLATAWVQLLVALTPLIPLFAQAVAWIIRMTSSDAGIRFLTWVLGTAGSALSLTAKAVEVLVGWFITATRWGQTAGAAIRDGFGSALNFVRGIPGQIGGVFSSAGDWLWNAGTQIIQGLINGIQSKINSLKSKLRELTNLIPNWKGPADRDRRLLVPSGRLIMTGLLAGIVSQVPVLQAQLASITSGISREFGAGVDRVAPRAPSPMIGRLIPAPSQAEPGNPDPPEYKLTAYIRVGDGPVHEAVEAAVASDPAKFASHLRTGERSLTRRG